MRRRIAYLPGVLAACLFLQGTAQAQQRPVLETGYRHAGEYVVDQKHRIRGIPGVGAASNPSLETCQAACDERANCKGFSRWRQQRGALCVFYDVSMQQAQADGSLVANRSYDYYEKIGGEAGPGAGDALAGFTLHERRELEREDRESIVGSPAQCAAACRDRPWCRSFEKHRMMARGTCHLSDKIPGDRGVQVVEANWDLYVRSDAVPIAGEETARMPPAREEPAVLTGVGAEEADEEGAKGTEEGTDRIPEADLEQARQGEEAREREQEAGGGALPDCNADGTINSFDADCALQVSVGLRPASLAGATAASILRLDVDADGEVTSGDARIIQQRVRDRAYRP